MKLLERIHSPVLVNARATAEQGLAYPVAEQEIMALSLGSCVTVSTLRESFTVEICVVEGNGCFAGRICNVLYRENALKLHDIIRFADVNILAIH